MSVLVRINLALGALFICAGLIAGYCCWTLLESNARREVLSDAALMLDSYTASEILPLLQEDMKNTFPPQSIPFYAATQHFLKLRERHPEFTYKEANDQSARSAG